MDLLPERVLDDWAAYFAVEPWPEDRADLRSALHSAHLHRSLTGEVLPIDKFMPNWNPKEANPQQDLDQAVQALAALCEEK
jgi:hypothetical protein